MNFNGKILLVDDEPHIRKFISLILKKFGHPIITEASNGEEALEAYQTNKPDFVLLDVNMPRMDGFSFLRTLRRSAADVATLPALVITTESGEDDLRAARAAGANFYLVKPVSQQDLVRHVAALSGEPT